MPGKNKRVVQTELELRDYEALANLARSKKKTIKEAAREELKWWSVSLEDEGDDPLFKLKPVQFKTNVRSDEIEAYLYKRN